MEINDLATNFCLPNHLNKDVCLSDFDDKWIIIYFYPKDNTSGCTLEALDFTNKKDFFERNNTIVIGISADSCISHAKFIEKHGLNLILLSDEKKDVLKMYGAWGEKINYGKKYEGIIRSTFIVSPDKKVMYKWKNVTVQQKKKDKVLKHVDVVCDKLIEFLK